MITLPLLSEQGHLFINIAGAPWLLDTGGPSSFGLRNHLTIDGQTFRVPRDYLGLNAGTLSELVGTPCEGLLGADILGCFDHLLDSQSGTITVSQSPLTHHGQEIPMEAFMGIPIVTARIGGRDYRMFFDTGAQISYFQDDALNGFPDMGEVTDFFPGFGQFQTGTHDVPVRLGGLDFSLRCGRLPALLGLTLQMGNTRGIIGNAILNGRTAGYFPRRSVLSL